MEDEKKSKKDKKFCPNCGAEVNNDGEFCAKCGKSFKTKEIIYNNVINYNIVEKKTNGLAVAGFVCSLCGFITCGVTSIIGLILSIVGLSANRKDGKYSGLAVAGLIISLLFLLLMGYIFIMAAIDNTPSNRNTSSKDYKMIIVPDFSKYTIDDAKKWCSENDANCMVSEEYSSTIESGNLISQSEKAEAEISNYKILKIVYSLGKEKTEKDKEDEYKNIARRPEDYKGQRAVFTGKVIQVVEGYSRSVVLRVEVTKDKYGFWDDAIYVNYKYSKGEDKILEDDIITMYGVIEGTKTYTSLVGNVTIPEMTAKYIEIQK